eukprot:jgi/Botrbrau1/21569/Bobra.174_2s0067.1
MKSLIGDSFTSSMAVTASRCGCTPTPCSDLWHAMRGRKYARMPQRWIVQGALPTQELVVNAPALQELIMGSGVVTAVGAALYNGLKGGPEICDLCQGTGGVKCFGCDATGKMKAIVLDAKAPKRDFVGRSVDPRTCRVCHGTCAILCRKCSGTGYTNKF